MREEAIIQTLVINRFGQRIYFQWELPKDTKRIIAIEYDATAETGEPEIGPSFLAEDGDPSLQLKANETIGRLTLKSAGCENIFFQAYLSEHKNIAFGEGITLSAWPPALWTHGRKREALEFSVNGDTNLVEGYFVDSWKMAGFNTIEYKLRLYLWIEKCTS